MENSVKMIFDIGMHEGDDTAYYLQNGYRVVAVEANPDLVRMSKRKFASHLDTGDLTVIDKCISTSDEFEMSFWINEDNSEWSSFDEQAAKKMNTRAHEIKIEAVTPDYLFEQYGVPYYLKIDIEESDIYVLEAIDANNKPQYISCEVGNPKLLDILQDKGYTKFKMINQASGFNSYSYWEERLYLPSLFRKICWKLRKIFFPNTIKYGDSGPFDEETSGIWKDYEAIKKDFLSYYPSEGKPINNLSWYDFHASY